MLGGSRMLEYIGVGANDCKITRGGSVEEALSSRVNGLLEKHT